MKRARKHGDTAAYKRFKETRKKINTILNEYPAMRPLLFVLKYYMRQKGLNVTYTGGISSFCLFSLVYAYILYVKKNKEFEGEITLGHLLIGFFDFFAFRFNYSKVGISVRLGGFFYKRSERFFRDNSSSVKGDGILSLENFQNINQDIGGNCFRYDEVTCDSAEQKSVSDYRSYGINARGAEKGPDSVRYGRCHKASLSIVAIYL